MSDTNTNSNSSKKHTMKTRKDGKVKDSEIDYSKEHDIDKGLKDKEFDNFSETTDESCENIDISKLTDNDDTNSENSNDDENTMLKRKFKDILDGDNTIIIVNNSSKKNKTLKNIVDSTLEDDNEDDEDYEDEVEEDEEYSRDEFDPEDPYNSFAQSFEKEFKKATELLKKNEEVIKENPNFKNYGREDVEYFLNLPKNKKKEFISKEKQTIVAPNEDIPLRFKILNSNIDDKMKSIAIKKLNLLNSMNEKSGEYFKIKTYVDNLCKIPCGIYKTLDIDNKSSPTKISNFLKDSYKTLDDNVYGHKSSKEQIIRIIAQWISNPSLKGNVIGIHGSPGVGKTKLIKDGLSKALNLPFVFIPLGGVNDSSYLTGHSFTYEGAIHGKIVNSLMNAECMNPIIYFDELDKISDSARGDEIINTLIHMTDSTQNNSFFDKYFYDVPLDLSKALIIFTYNNDHMINPILKDRMIRITTDDYDIKDKINISRKFLIPELCKDFNFKNDDLVFTDKIIKYIISLTDQEKGVRNLRRSFETIISNINLYRLTNFNNSSNNTTRNNKNNQFSINSLDISYSSPMFIDEYIINNLIKKKPHALSDSIAHIYI
jgi:ATP-dependent Lon protease